MSYLKTFGWEAKILSFQLTMISNIFTHDLMKSANWAVKSHNQGCIKFPTIWYSSPPPFFKLLISFPKILVPFPSSPQDNLPYSLKNIEQMILFPLTLFSAWYSSKTPLNYPSLFTTWNSSPKDLINFKWGTLYTPGHKSTKLNAFL